jgi:hypothetical protein
MRLSSITVCHTASSHLNVGSEQLAKTKMHNLDNRVVRLTVLLNPSKNRNNEIHKVELGLFSMAVIYCKKCGEFRYLTPHAFWNIPDFGAKCPKCETKNTITLETENLKNRYIQS